VRFLHATAAVGLRSATPRAQEFAGVAFDLGDGIGVVEVGEKARLDRRIVQMRFDDIVDEL